MSVLSAVSLSLAWDIFSTKTLYLLFWVFFFSNVKPPCAVAVSLFCKIMAQLLIDWTLRTFVPIWRLFKFLRQPPFYTPYWQITLWSHVRQRKRNFVKARLLCSNMTESCLYVTMDNLCCQICKSRLRSPATIPCGHNFCIKCISDSWDQEELGCVTYSCPECGYIFPNRPMLVKNKILDDLVREMETSQMNRDWNTMVTGRQGGSQCSKHRSPLDAYCCTDNQVICAACATEEHTGHTIGLVKEERRRKQVCTTFHLTLY